MVAACSGRGKCQMLSCFSELEGPLQEQAYRMLGLLEEVAENGPSRNPEICHGIEKDIWQFDAGKIRVLWFQGGHYEGFPNIVCAYGFKKDTKRTPPKHIDLVKRLRHQYLKDLKKDRIEILDKEEG